MSIPVKIILKKNEFVNVWVYESDYKKALDKGTLDYWVRGIGHKKTKKFELIEGLPASNEKISYLAIAKIADQYGLNIAEKYAESHTCGIMARQVAAGYHGMYKRCANLLNENDEELFALLKCDHMLGIIGVYELDIVGLDERLGKLDPEYKPELALYKDEPISMHNYVLQKYGQHACDIINACTKMPDVVKQVEVYRPGKGFVQEMIDSRYVTKFVKENYHEPNLLTLVFQEFVEWMEELDLEQIVKQACEEIDSKTLKLEL